MLILKLGQGICKVSLEHLVVPEGKEVLNTLTHSKGYVKRTQESNEGTPRGQIWNISRNKINKVVLDYNPNTCESILM